ncbi:DUF2267 domain-containing protein [Rhodospirillaceae bacterium SYSU D60014]|uniref:DUF2267 domain-containing protein n=1 Tax=Virgifigura deserti TaxID=2268457 RepID=UPI000E66DD92
MSSAGLDVFDDTIQKTNIWLKEIMEEIGPDRQRAYHALRAVLQTVRDRLTIDEAAHLAAQLPLMVRGIFFEGWRPAENPTKERSRDAFVAQVDERLKFIRPIDPEDAIRAVFKVLQHRVTGGEIEDVKRMLPQDLQPLWPQGV